VLFAGLGILEMLLLLHLRFGLAVVGTPFVCPVSWPLIHAFYWVMSWRHGGFVVMDETICW